MPIRPDLRPFYRGRAWCETRTRILTRNASRCEQCQKPNGYDVRTVSGVSSDGPWMYWSFRDGGMYLNHNGMVARNFLPLGPIRVVRVVLTVAHLNHVAGDDRDENLKALCQWCHLNYDKLHHAETRSTRKDAARPLLMEARG